ncbi:MAG TPA: anthranilate phosphoribosyltransferase [Nitrospiraceae bacterium]|nr:anthranilate phosphoribosyltransferase [Nitrospiraceae bacterium]
MSLQDFIVKIAKGPKAGKDLTWDEAKRAMKALIEGEATPAQTGAFLMALRIKLESVTELASLTAAARSYVAPVPIPRELDVVDLPSYAEKQETFHALVASAIVAASAGASVLMHGYDGIPGRTGTAGTLKALGLPTDMEPKVAAETVTRHGFAYLDIALYHPPVYRFLEMRQELGVRNVFHPVAKLLNPARATSQVVGLSHPPHFEKTAEVLRMLGCPRALVVSGVEGDPELSIAALTRVLELRDDQIMPFSFSPKDIGLAMGTQRDMAGFPSNQQDKEADLLRRILNNQLQGGPCNWILMNAALILYAAGRGVTLASCVPLARRALEGGAAARKLEELVQEPVAQA